MKIRTDYVTNSSSSSFIAIINNKIDKIESEDPVVQALFNFAITQITDYSNGVIDNETKLMEHLVYNYDLHDQLQVMVNEESRLEFIKLIGYINKDYRIYKLNSVDDCSDLHSLLGQLSGCDSDKIIVEYLDY